MWLRLATNGRLIRMLAFAFPVGERCQTDTMKLAECFLARPTLKLLVDSLLIPPAWVQGKSGGQLSGFKDISN